MSMPDIRNRMLLTAILPVTLIGTLLAAVFLLARVGDITEAHNQRARSLARQLAAASEFGLFSGNTAHLQSLTNGALRETDVRSVAIVDAQGRVLARTGLPHYARTPTLSAKESEQLDRTAHIDLLTQPITAAQVKLDELFEVRTDGGGKPPPVLGHVLLEVSRTNMLAAEQDILWVGMAITLGGLLFSGVLAIYMGRGVILPVLRVSRMIERLGRGELSARIEVRVDDPLSDLQRDLNLMAARLESGRDEMEQRVAQATLELRAKKEEAETAALAKSRFLAAASHDLRQPTHALGMFVARLTQLPHDAETKHLISNLDASVRATQDLLDALLDISRLDADAVQVQARPFALSTLFAQLRDSVSAQAQENGLVLRVRATDAWVYSDPTLLARVLMNLLVNALHYTRRGGALLACRLVQGGHMARIEVWDSGIGIAQEHQQAVFHEFYQVSNSQRDRNKGLGLGLNIVKRTTKLLGHPLHLCSRLHHGTRFSIDVPLATPGTRAARSASPPLMSAAQDALVDVAVLVIEDDMLARNGLVSLLEGWGAVVAVAEDFESAMVAMQRGLVPAVIISDYRLRDGENGIDTLRMLHQTMGLSVPACLMSGDTDPGLMQAAKAAGLTLLHKPVRPAKLRSLLHRLVAEPLTPGEQAYTSDATSGTQADGRALDQT